MPAPHELPPPNDDDYLEHLFGYLVIAREFKSLVIDLSSGDLSGSEYFGEDLSEASVEDDGRLSEHFQITHGHYNVELPDVPVINEVSEINTSVELSTYEGGRRYYLSLDDRLGGLMTVTYYEDMPPQSKTGSNQQESANILKRFSLTREAARDKGVFPDEMKYIQALTTGVLAVMAAGRMIPVEECRCF